MFFYGVERKGLVFGPNEKHAAKSDLRRKQVPASALPAEEDAVCSLAIVLEQPDDCFDFGNRGDRDTGRTFPRLPKKETVLRLPRNAQNDIVSRDCQIGANVMDLVDPLTEAQSNRYDPQSSAFALLDLEKEVVDLVLLPAVFDCLHFPTTLISFAFQCAGRTRLINLSNIFALLPKHPPKAPQPKEPHCKAAILRCFVS